MGPVIYRQFFQTARVWFAEFLTKLKTNSVYCTTAVAQPQLQTYSGHNVVYRIQTIFLILASTSPDESFHELLTLRLLPMTKPFCHLENQKVEHLKIKHQVLQTTGKKKNIANQISILPMLMPQQGCIVVWWDQLDPSC